MDNPTIHNSVGFHLIHAWKHHRNYFMAKLDELGLQGGEEFILAQLSETDGVSQSDLAEALSVEPPTITKLVRSLEARDLVERHQDPDDARVHQVFITEEGEKMVEPIEACWAEGEDVMLAGFTDEERLLLRRMLIQIRENIDMPEETA